MIATVDSSDMEVMAELGVPLRDGMSDGVTGSDGGGGRLNSVGALDMAAVVEVVLRHERCRLCLRRLMCTV